MSLQLIYGPSGSGKSTYLSECILRDIKDGRRCYLLVPDQQEFITEDAYLKLLEPSARRWFEVTSFSRLYRKAANIWGGGAGSLPEAPVRMVLLWNAIRMLKGGLVQYTGAPDSALTSVMFSTLNEFFLSGKTPDQMAACLETLSEDSPLRAKLRDLSMISAFYQESLKDLTGVRHIDPCAFLAEQLAEHNYFEETHVYVDSFTGFTSSQSAVLERILCQADRVTVTVAADSLNSKLQHYAESVRMARRLTRTARNHGIEVESLSLTEDGRHRTASLRYLEKSIWNYSVRPGPDAPDDDGSVRLMACDTIYTEAEATALKIMELVSEGIRFSEIAVTVGQTEAYAGILDATFKKYGIPCFLSSRVDLAVKPISRMLLSALRVAAYNFRKEDLIALGKTGLCGVSRDELDLFANYCEIWDINGPSAFDRVWTMNPDGLSDRLTDRGKQILEAANRVRERLVPPLKELSGRLSQGSHPVTDCCTALYDYMTRMQIQTRIGEIAKREILENRNRDAGDTVRTYDEVCRVLVTLCDVLPEDTVFTLPEFSQALTILLQQTDLGSVPNVFDCVTIGASGHLRVEHIRAMFVLGLNDGELPASVSEKSLLTDSDRKELAAHDLELDSDADILMSRELFGLYRAFSKPSRYLIVSCQTHRPTGEDKNPSIAFRRIQALLPNAELTVVRDADIPEEAGPEPVRSEETEIFRAEADSAPVPSGPVILSSSSARTFETCPYRYFITYEMALTEKARAELSYSLSGTLAHKVLEDLLKDIYVRNRPFPADDAELMDRIRDTMNAALSGFTDSGALSPDRDFFKMHQLYKLTRNTFRMARGVLDELKTTQFRPSFFELYLGVPDNADGLHSPLRLDDGTDVLFKGKIDRVDLLKAPDGTYVRIGDYKTGKVPEPATDRQLWIYLMMLTSPFYTKSLHLPELIPASGCFFGPSQEDGKDLDMKGVYLDRPDVQNALPDTVCKPYSQNDFDQRMNDVRTEILDLAQRIQDGERPATPSKDACTNCPHAGSCPGLCHSST